MANIIQISTNRVLKITNALIQEIDIRDSSKINIMVSQMGNYIKSKGMMWNCQEMCSHESIPNSV